MQKRLLVTCSRRSGAVIVPASEATCGSRARMAFLCDDRSIQPAHSHGVVGEHESSPKASGPSSGKQSAGQCVPGAIEQ